MPFYNLQEIKIAEHWAHKNNVPFPPIDVNIMEKEGIKECYVFEDRKDPKCPTILHFVLSNINFRNETQPGNVCHCVGIFLQMINCLMVVITTSYKGGEILRSTFKLTS